MLCMKWTLVNIKHILNNTKVESKQLHFNIKISAKNMPMQSILMSETSVYLQNQVFQKL